MTLQDKPTETLIIDPGFVHHRKVLSLIGEKNATLLDEQVKKIKGLPDWQVEVRIDHIYTEALTHFCKINNVKTLEEIIATKRGNLFCSIEKILRCPNFYDEPRSIIKREIKKEDEIDVEFHFSQKRVKADTLKMYLNTGGKLGFIGLVNSFNASNNTLVVDPLIIGLPYLVSQNRIPLWLEINEYYKISVEDIKNFEKIKDSPLPDSSEPMRHISELAFKKSLQKIFGDSTQKDWGGEKSDFFTSHLTCNGTTMTAAFLLKGPAKFTPMNLSHLGKNKDQIIRLSHEPVDALIVQHCHDIGSEVQETLKAFAIQPSNPRKYCLIDGRQSLRILQAYDLYNWAVDETKKARL
ncbi:MAG: Methyltransferase [Segetibacter sp.]|nr:Methyltransferase [Segetibacter sp.]